MPTDELLEALTEVLNSLDSEERENTPPDNSSIKTKVKKLEELYAIETVANPTDPKWEMRVIEELKAFKALKDTQYGDLLPHFRYLTPYEDKDQFLLVQYRMRNEKWEWAIIRLPLFYPSLPPSSIHSKSRELHVYTKHTDPNKCLGHIVSNRWTKGGEMGVPHWLCFCEVFISLRDRPITI